MVRNVSTTTFVYKYFLLMLMYLLYYYEGTQFINAYNKYILRDFRSLATTARLKNNASDYNQE